MRNFSSLILALIFSVTGCVTTQPKKPAPAYLSAESSCAVVVGGAIGDYYGDRQVDEFWFKANNQISEILLSILQDEKFKAVGLTVKTHERERIAQLLATTAAKNECNRIIQLSHTTGIAPAGNYFQFEVSVLRLQPEAWSNGLATNATTLKLFSKDYRYPRTTASMSQFHTGEFAEKVFNDLKLSKQLEALR